MAEREDGAFPGSGRLPIKQVIVVRKDLNMRKGKLAAQVAHASMAFFVQLLHKEALSLASEFPVNVMAQGPLSVVEALWLSDGKSTKTVPYVVSEAELQALIEKATAARITVHPITDSGATEFHGVPTLTCAAFGPDYVSKLDPITGHLPLL